MKMIARLLAVPAGAALIAAWTVRNAPFAPVGSTKRFVAAESGRMRDNARRNTTQPQPTPVELNERIGVFISGFCTADEFTGGWGLLGDRKCTRLNTTQHPFFPISSSSY